MKDTVAKKLSPEVDVLPPRERILAAARELFYERGIHSVSVDQVAEAASSNKMTLYRHFKSKDELVAECMRECAAEWQLDWDKNARAHAGDPMGQLRAWLKEIAECKTDPEDRGCALANAAVQLPQTDHPARSVIEDCKRLHREEMIKLCGEAGFLEPERLGDAIFLTVEGAAVCQQSFSDKDGAARLMRMFEALLAAHPRR